MAYEIPSIPFSLRVPAGYNYELNPNDGVALRLTPKASCPQLNEITLTTVTFQGKYSKENEKRWVEDFLKIPEISTNKDLNIKALPPITILGEERIQYLYSLKNEAANNEIRPEVEILGLIIPSGSGWNGLLIYFSNSNGNPLKTISSLDLSILNSIKYQ